MLLSKMLSQVIRKVGNSTEQLPYQLVVFGVPNWVTNTDEAGKYI